MTEFKAFPKIARFSREVLVTEKIDGTNASIFIGEDGEFLTGSRTRWITPEDDNHGFALWARAHQDELMLLGPGLHYGEWWGSGIQRGYGLEKGEKRFSLFNVLRWEGADLPDCVDLVPKLWQGNFSDLDVEAIIADLRDGGSHAAPGFMRPEGIIVFHTAGCVGFKKTLEKDEQPKSFKGAAQ